MLTNCYFFSWLRAKVIFAADYEVVQFQSSPGVFYDYLGSAVFFNTEWKLAGFVDLDTVEREVSLVQKEIERTVSYCSEQLKEDKQCKEIITSFSDSVNTLKQSENDLKIIIGHSRSKRSLFSGIWNTAKMIAGSLSFGDIFAIGKAVTTAIDYSKSAINSLRPNKKTKIEFQVEVLEHSILALNESLFYIKEQKKMLQNSFDFLKNRYSVLENDLSESIKLEKHFQSIQALLNNIRTKIQRIVDCILFAKDDIVHPSVMTDTQLISEMKNAVFQIPKKLSFPFLLTNGNAKKILDIISIHAFLQNNVIIFVLSIPLIENAFYNLYNTIPLPIERENQVYFFIQPVTRFLAISDDNFQYTLMKDIENCKLVDNKHFLCKQNSLNIMSVQRQTICEVEILFSNEISNHNLCNMRYVKIEHEIWHPLLLKNQWLYVLPKKTRLSVTCESGERKNMFLYGTGIFNSRENCKSSTIATNLQTYLHERKNITLEHDFQKISVRSPCEVKNNTNYATLLLHKVNFPTNDLNDINPFSVEVCEIMRTSVHDSAIEIVLEYKVAIYSFIIFVSVGALISIIVFIKLKCFSSLKPSRQSQSVRYKCDSDSDYEN